jgi:hypothetical protein
MHPYYCVAAAIRWSQVCITNARTIATSDRNQNKATHVLAL